MKATLAVIFTCHNRKEKTYNCIKSLLAQEEMPNFDLYVCDDGSTDGTAEMIKKLYPQTNIINGNGSLFWSRGMYAAMKRAVEKEYDLYLMINDDVIFKSNMWVIMSEPFLKRKKIGVVGYTESFNNGTITYGGRRMYKTLTNYFIGERVEINSKINSEVDVANWNCFLIDSYVVHSVGLIDNYYEHGLGDYDYCLRMRKKEIKILVAKDTIGFCENNSKKNTYLDSTLKRKIRIQKMLKPNGFPIRSWFHFVNRHYGRYKYRSAIAPYFKNFLLILMGRDIK